MPSSGAVDDWNMTANVVCFNASGGGGPALTVSFPGLGQAAQSSPSGFTCASRALRVLQAGTTVTDNATANDRFTFTGELRCGVWQVLYRE